MLLKELEEEKKINKMLRKRILKVLSYIEDVMNSDNDKQLSLIRDELLGSSLSHLLIRGEAKPPREYNLNPEGICSVGPNCFCGLTYFVETKDKATADDMSRLNLKKNP